MIETFAKEASLPVKTILRRNDGVSTNFIDTLQYKRPLGDHTYVSERFAYAVDPEKQPNNKEVAISLLEIDRYNRANALEQEGDVLELSLSLLGVPLGSDERDPFYDYYFESVVKNTRIVGDVFFFIEQDNVIPRFVENVLLKLADASYEFESLVIADRPYQDIRVNIVGHANVERMKLRAFCLKKGIDATGFTHAEYRAHRAVFRHVTKTRGDLSDPMYLKLLTKLSEMSIDYEVKNYMAFPRSNWIVERSQK